MSPDDSTLAVPHECLVTRAQAGCTESMGQLIALVRPMIFRYCRSRLARYAGGLEIADDVAQEICLSVFTMIGRYRRHAAPFTSWVYGIAANKVVDAQRRMMRAPTPVETVPEREDAAPSPEDRAITVIDSELARRLLAQLPERTRRVMVLRTHGMSAEETGRQVGMSAGAVRVTYHRGLARLRLLAAADRASGAPDEELVNPASAPTRLRLVG